VIFELSGRGVLSAARARVRALRGAVVSDLEIDEEAHILLCEALCAIHEGIELLESERPELAGGD
jgi:hypothetical protein